MAFSCTFFFCFFTLAMLFMLIDARPSGLTGSETKERTDKIQNDVFDRIMRLMEEQSKNGLPELMFWTYHRRHFRHHSNNPDAKLDTREHAAVFNDNQLDFI